ncbi:right-handed parallel beta-helix repeat-containing protein [Leeuwenhoekiella parthenopeia]|uniref:Right-handed parallel beta-helix repeat-containing protein n=1 Tax=Leeuwenhoekiella parthenopeia TaxID=2890320 RepID=A0ABS8GPV5_9FLAO|nr:right-handed parallel beta-helix repeat-containing protein [Leeuwenhoekiella parthenopeia]MCC4212000.1 right-handed parallel beta-helix repeat-containing protein [Leeuwenhoekiella parthenopeia]
MNRFCAYFLLMLLTAPYVNAQYQFSLPDHFRTARDLPLTDIPTGLDVNLIDFGAVPNDGKNDTPAIMKALNFCKKISQSGPGVRLLFEKGIYDLHSNPNAPKRTHILDLANTKNIIVDGNGAEIIVHDPLKGFFSLFKSENIIIKNFFIDYDPLPFTQGKITEVDKENKFFKLKINAGFPSLKEDMFQQASRVWGMLMDPNIPGKLKDGAPNLFASKDFEEVSPGHFKIKINSLNLLSSIEVGDLYVHMARTNGMSIFKTGNSKNITYLNNTNYSSPAGSYNAFDMEEWNIIGAQVKLKPGRIHSANADCVHVNGGKFGPWIENSLFEGYSDDAINMKATKRYILEQRSSTELIVKFQIAKGELIKVFNPREGKLIGQFKVIDNKYLGDNEVAITLDKPLEETLNTGETKKNDFIYLDTQANESFVIRNNTFRNARRYGILLQNAYGVIERNVFANLSQSAITIENGVDWGEGFVAHDILINKNLFKNCGYDLAYSQQDNAATIKMSIGKLKNPDSKEKWSGVETVSWQGIENITITNNTFSYNKRALAVECTINTVVKSNQFIRNSEYPSEVDEILMEKNNTNLVFENP